MHTSNLAGKPRPGHRWRPELDESETGLVGRFENLTQNLLLQIAAVTTAAATEMAAQVK